MPFKRFKSGYMSALDYVSHQQHYGESMGGMQMLNRRLKYSRNLFRKDLYAHYGCVNAIEFSNDGQWMISGGDDKRVLIWNMNKTLTSVASTYQPVSMKSEHNSNIFCLAFDKSHTKLLSAGNDEQVILHDINTRESLDVFLHQEAVYGLSADPTNDNLFATSCDDGRILIWDIRQSPNDPIVLADNTSAYHAVMHNPIEPCFLATANAKLGVCLHDIRKPKSHVMKYGSSLLTTSAMSVRFNALGNQILALRRRLPPVMYNVTSTHEIAEFDNPEYYNSCTMKSCCFAGEKDQYVLSGSDDFKLYVWKVPDTYSRKNVKVKKTQFILRGHRSIVNQVRCNNTYGIIASSGVEKIIKLWSTFPYSYSERDVNELRKVYSHEEYINLVLHSGPFMTHDYSHRSTREDPHMMAFFDSLVQRDIEGWTSDSNDAIDPKTKEQIAFTVQSSGDSTTTWTSSSSEDELVSIAQANKSMPSNSNIIQMQEESLTGSRNQNSLTNNLSTNPVTDMNLSGTNEEDAVNHSSTNRGAIANASISSGESVLDQLFPNSEVGVTRRLFPGRREAFTNRILADTEGVASSVFSSREGATSRLFASREEAASYLLANRQASGRQLFNRNANNDVNSSSDRISQLIAQKRRIHKLKLARKSMKVENLLLKKQYKKIKKSLGEKSNENSSAVCFKPLNIEAINNNEASSKDKRKLLRKKRAKLSKLPNLEDNSSDSDFEGLCNSALPNDTLAGASTSNNVSNGNNKKEGENNSDGIVNFLYKRYRNFKRVSDMAKETITCFQSLADANTSPQRDSSSTSENSQTIAGNGSSEVNLNPCSSGINVQISSNTGATAFSKVKTAEKNNPRESNGTSLSDVTDAIVTSGEKVTLDKDTSDISDLNNSLTDTVNTSFTRVEGSLQCGNSNSAFSFPVSVGKTARNYRKRSAEDSKDD